MSPRASRKFATDNYGATTSVRPYRESVSESTESAPPKQSEQSAACRSFSDLSLEDVDWAGGKGANLGELSSSGFAVPSGFVIGAPAYAEFCDGTGLREKLAIALNDLRPEDSRSLADAAAVTHALVEITVVPPGLVEQISVAHARLCSDRPDLPVAVRSSAIGEDAATASFAGMHASFLNVRGREQLLRAVQQCWASLYSERTLYYRATGGMPLADMDIAVVVQKQLVAKRSGVMFTIDPTNGRDDRVVVEASLGLGESIVSGAVSPDRFVFEKGENAGDAPFLSEKYISHKTISIDSDLSGGTVTRKLTKSEETHAAIDESEATQIAHNGIAIEAHYGKPQDIEWALDQAGVLWILQSRPITTVGGGQTESPTVPHGAVLLSGVGAGPGAATGAVRLIESPKEGENFEQGELLVAHTTRPDWVPLMRRAAGIITDSGGVTCHAAIVARELGIPCIVGTGDATEQLIDGQVVTIDAANGTVLAGEQRVEIAAAEISAERAMPADASPSVTTESPPTRTKILVNLSDPEQVDLAAAMNVDGVGLLRAEILVLHALDGKHPKLLIEQGQGEEFVAKMAAALGRFAAGFSPRPITYRTIDFRTNEFRDLEGGDRFEPVEDNPMIGMRGVQRYLRDPEFFALELAAVRRVWDGGDQNLHLMLPFVRSANELAQCRELIAQSGLTDLPGFELWVMAEVPSILFILESIAEQGVAGISIGTNDLTQLLLGSDRESAELAESFDATDPAVVAYLRQLIPQARQLGLKTSICGQAPSVYPEYAEILVDAGIDAISVSVDAVEQARANVARAEGAQG